MTHDLPEGYTIASEQPSVADYRRLRRNAGLSPKSAEAGAAGLPNTWHAVVVRHCDAGVVGMGRIVGDGGLFFFIVDIAVEPAHQGRGLGKAIMAGLMTHLRANGPASAHVGLFADGEAHRLYARFGFKPTAPESIGMALVL
ncbi:GNAT family N-acetyltransferase [Stakelama saccharophila]|uniref:GNAT family N-acetyltransferase n=1 Tax=Stakelama saccharophila TaxID=3075605 RepID=A0ABZ0BB02_9SPHN|nr:GNAT family N-acetyltransferase [Stakelama sp. W311]WNO53861.1 GNAT family N-acetyltransferase [Stakelama sp. W311]